MQRNISDVSKVIRTSTVMVQFSRETAKISILSSKREDSQYTNICRSPYDNNLIVLMDVQKIRRKAKLN